MCQTQITASYNNLLCVFGLNVSYVWEPEYEQSCDTICSYLGSISSRVNHHRLKLVSHTFCMQPLVWWKTWKGPRLYASRMDFVYNSYSLVLTWKYSFVEYYSNKNLILWYCKIKIIDQVDFCQICCLNSYSYKLSICLIK